MPDMIIKNLRNPDEIRSFTDKGRAEIFRLGDVTVGRVVMEPGWRWSEHVRPIAQTRSCMASHTGYCVSGRMLVRMDDGTEHEIGPGDAFVVPAGHDGWVLGSEPFVAYDFTGMEQYAKPARPPAEAPPPVH